MAPRQKGTDARNTGYLAKPNIGKSSQQLSVLKVQGQGKRPQRVSKKRPQDHIHRSARLQKRHRIEDRTVLYHTRDAKKKNHPYSLLPATHP
ncbi:threonine aldolase [Histoplasma ohiense]|nr:threonine aldolase [Histoplasma ohiense (nom. inval.)]